MKFFILFTLMLIALVGYTSAQGCIGKPSNADCNGGRDVGFRGGSRCLPRIMWYWTGRECASFGYFGCGGNNNRYCSRRACQQRCRR